METLNKTKYPINIYLLFIVFIAFNLFNYKEGKFLIVLSYSILICILFFYIFSRYAARIFETHDKLEVKYFLSFRNIILEKKNIKQIAIKKGFYSIFSDNTIVEVFVFPVYCYDILQITYNDNSIKNIKVNTRLWSLDRFVRKIKGI